MNDPNLPAAAGASPHDLSTQALSAESPRWSHRLANGRTILVRAIAARDAALERTFIERLSPESRRFRFLCQMSTPGDDLIRRLTDIDYVHDVAFVALVHEDNEKKEIGVARYSVSPDGRSCECAVTVADDWRHLGVGTALLRHLVDVARERGMREMYSIDAAENHAMRDFAHSAGFTRNADPQDPTQVIYRLAL